MRAWNETAGRALVLLALLATAGCGREFAAPPEAVRIESIEPAAGFAGQAVVIHGRRLDGDVSVSFANTPAASRPLAADPGGMRLALVPLLDAPGPVDVRVADAGGQAMLEQAFVYHGPGHPTAERVQRELVLESAPISVSAVPQGHGMPGSLALVANEASRTIALVDAASGWHLEVGLRDKPLGAVALAPVHDPQDAHHHTLPVLLTALQVGDDQPDGAFLSSALYELDIELDEQQAMLWLEPQALDAAGTDGPALEEELADGQPLLPGALWRFCTGAGGGCDQPLVVVADLYRPALALLHRSAAHESWQTELLRFDQLDSPCGPPAATPPADVALLDTPLGARLLVVLRDRPELLVVPLLGQPPLEAGPPLVAWPQAADDTLCQARFQALAAARDGSAVFAAEQHTRAIYGVGGGQVGLDELGQLEVLADLGAPAFDLALFYRSELADAAQRLCAATEGGLLCAPVGADQLSDGLTPDDLLELPGSRGGAQTLAALVRGLAHEGLGRAELAFADTVGNRLLVLPFGNEAANPAALPLGASQPWLAPSRFGDKLYLADPRSNTVRLIDDFSGVQADQYCAAFGGMYFTCLHDHDQDLLLTPQRDGKLFMHGAGGRPEFVGLDVRLVGGMDEIMGQDPAAADACRSSFVGFDYPVPEGFHHMLPAPRHSRLYLVRYPSPGGAGGRVWALGFDTAHGDVGQVFPGDRSGDQPFTLELDDWVERVRLGSRERALALFGHDPSRGHTVAVVPIEKPSGGFSHCVQASVGSQVSDLALVSDATGERVVLALPEAGRLLVINRAGEQRLLDTGGAPERLFVSPDGGRLYASHRSEGKLSVIGTDCGAVDCLADSHCTADQRCAWGRCQPAGGCSDDADCASGRCLAPAGDGSPAACYPPICESVRTTLAVAADAERISFHPDGRAAYVTHGDSNVLDVVE
jgi:hypothetical protein